MGNRKEKDKIGEMSNEGKVRLLKADLSDENFEDWDKSEYSNNTQIEADGLALSPLEKLCNQSDEDKSIHLNPEAIPAKSNYPIPVISYRDERNHKIKIDDLLIGHSYTITDLVYKQDDLSFVATDESMIIDFYPSFGTSIKKDIQEVRLLYDYNPK